MTEDEIYYDGRLDDALLADYRKARAAYLAGDRLRADQLYSANRRHHAVDLFYEVALPEHVMFVHPLGTVLGRATYGDYLVCYQNVGVGSDVDGNRPTIGRGVVLFPGAKVLGKTVLGNNVWVTANTVVQDCVIPDNSIVFPDLGFKTVNAETWTAVRAAWRSTKRSVIERYWPEATT